MVDDDAGWDDDTATGESADDAGWDDDTATDESADDDSAGYTLVGEDDDGPTVKIGGPDTVAEELRDHEDDEGEGIAGPFSPESPVQPETPEAENALFVTLGAFLTLFMILSVSLQMDPTQILGLAGLVAVASGGLYGLFRRFD